MHSPTRLLKVAYLLVLGTAIVVLSSSRLVHAQRALMAPMAPRMTMTPLVGGWMQAYSQAQAQLPMAANPQAGSMMGGMMGMGGGMMGMGGGMMGMGGMGGMMMGGSRGMGGGMGGMMGMGGGMMGMGGGMMGMGGMNMMGMGGMSMMGMGGFAGKGMGGFNGRKAL